MVMSYVCIMIYMFILCFITYVQNCFLFNYIFFVVYSFMNDKLKVRQQVLMTLLNKLNNTFVSTLLLIRLYQPVFTFYYDLETIVINFLCLCRDFHNITVEPITKKRYIVVIWRFLIAWRQNAANAKTLIFSLSIRKRLD